MTDEIKSKYTVDGGEDAPSPPDSVPTNGREELLKLIDASEDKHFVFMFGTPASGKTAVLGAMLRAMMRPDSPGRLFVHGSDGYFKDGAALWKRIDTAFTNKEFPPRSSAGSTIQLHAQFVPHANRSPLHLIFLEMAGEDLRQVMIKDSGGRTLPFHVGQFLKIPTLKISFLVTTSWSEAKRDDAAIDDFLSFLNEKAPHLVDNRFILLITKWDTKTVNQTESIDEFVRRTMPRTYNKLSSQRNVIQPFSIGTVVSFDGAGGDVISSFDDAGSERLFSRIFETFTGVSSEPTKVSKWKFWK